MLRLKTKRMTSAPWCSATKEELEAAVRCLKDNFIAYDGPFVINTGVAVFKVSEYLLSADELVSFYKSGRLTEESLAKCSSNTMNGEKESLSESNR
jgi:hypothetical protein